MDRRYSLAFAAALAASGCVFQDVREQQQRIDSACVVSGRIEAAGTQKGPFVVGLVRAAPAGAPRPWQLIDHFVLEAEGTWAFVAVPGEYRIAAFEDANRDFRYQPGEAFVPPEQGTA